MAHSKPSNTFAAFSAFAAYSNDHTFIFKKGVKSVKRIGVRDPIGRIEKNIIKRIDNKKNIIACRDARITKIKLLRRNIKGIKEDIKLCIEDIKLYNKDNSEIMTRIAQKMKDNSIKDNSNYDTYYSVPKKLLVDYMTQLNLYQICKERTICINNTLLLCEDLEDVITNNRSK